MRSTIFFRNEDFYCDILKCMSSVLENTEVQSADMFQDLFSSLCMFISLPGNPVRGMQSKYIGFNSM